MATTVGNHAFASIVARQPRTRQRSSSKAKGKELEARVDMALSFVTLKHETIMSTVKEGRAKIKQDIRPALEAVAACYEIAYDVFSKAVEAGKAHVDETDELIQSVLGIALGVGVGLGVGAAIKLSEQAALLAKAGGEALSEVGELAGAAAIDRPKSPGGELQPEHPGLKKAEAYRQLLELYDSLLELSLAVQPLAHVLRSAAELKADCRELARTGRHESLSPAQLENRVAAFEHGIAEMPPMGLLIGSLALKIEEVREAAVAAKADVKLVQMERRIWIRWMASLKGSQQELLQADPIEVRLSWLGLMAEEPPWGTQYSLIGWDIGGAHWDSDSAKGVKKAAKYAAALDTVGKVAKFVGLSPPPNWPDSTAGRVRVIGDPWYKTWNMVVAGKLEVGDRVLITSVLGAADRTSTEPRLRGIPEGDAGDPQKRRPSHSTRAL
jgi:hypothetical protein